MKVVHTPGPWLVTEGSDWSGMNGVSLGIDDAFGQDGGRDYHLATVVHGDPDVLQANALLVAAAPELLGDLREAATTLRRYEALHRAKGTAESDAKAELNAALAARFEATIAKATL